MGGVRHATLTIYHAYHFVTDIGHALRPTKIPLIQTRDTLKIDGPPIDSLVSKFAMPDRVDGWPAKLQQICHGHVLLPFVRRSFGLFL